MKYLSILFILLFVLAIQVKAQTSNCDFQEPIFERTTFPASGGSIVYSTNPPRCWSDTGFTVTEWIPRGIFVQPNTGPARYGQIELNFVPTGANRLFAIFQESGCAYSLSSAVSPTLSAFGGEESVSFSGRCQWEARANVEWITLQGNTSGTGNATLYYVLSANTGATRTGTIKIGGEYFTVNQASAVKSRKRVRFF
jgi:hypothetical protein